MKTKRCSRCHKRKASNEFYKRSTAKDGLRCQCKDCVSKDARIRTERRNPDARKYRSYDESHRTVRGINQKYCIACHTFRSYNRFNKSKSMKDGLHAFCKDCMSRKSHTKYRKENPIIKCLTYERSHQTINGVKQKRCPGCKEFKPLNEFYKCKRGKDDLGDRCKACVKEYRQSRKTEIAEYSKEYNRTHKAESSENHKEYYRILKNNLHRRYHNLDHRCNDSKDAGYKQYGSRGIKNLFGSFDKFFIHVTIDLGLTYNDIKGKDIHRIDGGDYEIGGVEFLTRAEHAAKHRAMREQEKLK